LALPFILAALPLIIWGPQPISQIHLWDSIYLPLSMAGVERCINITIKAWLSITAAILLTGTTPFLKLITGFRQLRIPLILISIIELMWRYLFVLVDEVNRLIRARSSRSSTINGKHHPGGSIFWRGRVTGNMAGSLFLRSIERSERIYAAMLSRGYNGEPFEEQTGKFSMTDQWVLSVSLMVLIVIYFLGLITGR
jgi:cobalt/nickel transport system permease protein